MFILSLIQVFDIDRWGKTTTHHNNTLNTHTHGNSSAIDLAMFAIFQKLQIFSLSFIFNYLKTTFSTASQLCFSRWVEICPWPFEPASGFSKQDTDDDLRMLEHDLRTCFTRSTLSKQINVPMKGFKHRFDTLTCLPADASFSMFVQQMPLSAWLIWEQNMLRRDGPDVPAPPAALPMVRNVWQQHIGHLSQL